MRVAIAHHVAFDSKNAEDPINHDVVVCCEVADEDSRGSTLIFKREPHRSRH